MVARIYATNTDFCDIQCFMESACVSYNFGPSDNGDGNICELNNSTEQQHLRPRLFFKYRGTKVSAT